MKLSTLERKPYVAALLALFTLNLSDDGIRLLARDRDSIGGSRMTTLRRFLLACAGGRCAHCRQTTLLNVASVSVDSATCALLIPASMAGDSNMRSGYIAGNVVNLCRGCVNLSNRAYSDGSVWVWAPDTLDAECVPLTWPSLPKNRKPVEMIESTVDPVKWMAECVRVAAARGNVLPS